MIDHYLDLSTGHLTPETRKALEDHLPDINYTGHEYGWWVYANDDGEILDEIYPKDLARVCRFARKHNCTWINFDCDAERIDDLPYYEEEPLS